jgi:RNA polymerase sigma-70 factor (ECF subfamily)
MPPLLVLALAAAYGFLALGVLPLAVRLAEDGDLIRRLKAHEPRAMSELYDRYARVTYSLILRIVRNAAVAEDLVQETFLRVWHRVHSFNADKGALGAWLLAVARNRAIDHLRSVDGRMEINAISLNHLEKPAWFTNLDTGVLALDRMRRLKGAFEKLTPHQRQVIEMAYYEGMSQSEMAERLKQPLGTVKTWTRSALKILRDELTEEAAIA